MLNGGARPKASIVDVDGARAQADAHEPYRRVAFSVLVSNVDDYLRNHGFLRRDRNGWRLSSVYDLNPFPTDLKARILSTNINFDDGTCSIDLLLESAENYALDPIRARRIVREVADAARDRRAVAADVRACEAEIERMASAFDHDDADQARVLS